MPRAVWVVVLGDFGRSPRMQYHTLSLSQNGFQVYVIAFPGSSPPQEIQRSSSITITHIQQLPQLAARVPTLLALLLKAVYQLLSMVWLMLFKLPRPDAILMQNPPAIPSMLVCWLAAKRHRAQWIVDWHNLAYTIMQLKYARHGWLINIARSYERWIGRQAQHHFCVTAAMQQFLQQEFGVKATVLYDRPPAMFHTCSMQEIHSVMGRLQQQLEQQGIGQCLQQHLAVAAAAGTSVNGLTKATLLTSLDTQGTPCTRQGRPALVVSSTSWTPDEDFGILLEAAQQYDAAASAAAGANSFPDIVFIITGRGPDRDMYLQRIRQLKLNKVAFCSLWLESEDYPLMLGAADLGVCLHTSSSGLDLPMKVVDMFGAGLPVCAVQFRCIGELITAGRTGLLFSNASELSQQLQDLFSGFGGNEARQQLAQMRNTVRKEQSNWRWQDNWNKVAAPVFAATLGSKKLA
eukprot:GHUV01018167.1.p1 GENE.GHUV01018167.1~~GHUV01018167.1.p1  ORF type:complete len:462 (+),score=151.64 GHUV01018167.1:240-1625(+)